MLRCWVHVLLLVCMIGAENILMVTMGGTKSHTVPFVALSRVLTSRSNNVTLLSGFQGVAAEGHAEELSPPDLVSYIKNYTQNWDLLGRRWRGEEAISPYDTARYAVQACNAMLIDRNFQYFLHSGRTYDLIILDGAYVECALGLVYQFKSPFMYINTVGMYTAPLSMAGNPEPYATTPFFNTALSDDMNIVQRLGNAAIHTIARVMRFITVTGFIQPALQKTFGAGMPCVIEMQRNVSIILQNGNAVLTYPRALLPNVAEVACMHCHAPRPLSKDLERWVSESSPHGTIIVSMGSSVQSVPAAVRRVFMRAFNRLPYRFIWKLDQASNETTAFPEQVPPNVKLVNWLPQQDLLGHSGVVALISHGGLLSVFEAAWHGKPMLTLPVFCDHDANAVRAEQNGYAIRMELRGLSAESLATSVSRLVTDPRYRLNAERISHLLQEHPLTPMQRAVYWTEHVMRHRGAPHLQGAVHQLGFIRWLCLDILALLMLVILCTITLSKLTSRILSSLTFSKLFVTSVYVKTKQH